MTKQEQNRVNDFIRNITNGPNRFMIQPPGEQKHKMVVTVEHIIKEFNSMAKDLEEMENGPKS